MNPYPVPSDKWSDTAIQIVTNPITGALDGDDHGYRDVPDIDSLEELVDVDTNLFCTPDYDGKDIYGGSKRVLPGGVRGGKLLLRRSFADGLYYLERLIGRVTGGAMQLQFADGYRTPTRQAAGFTETFTELAAIEGLTLDTLTAPQQVLIGRKADLTFAWVRLVDDSAYRTVLAELMRDTTFTRSLQEALDGRVLTGTLEDAVADYIIHSVNSNTGRAAGRGIQFNGNKTAHAGGGAGDLMLRGRINGRMMPLSHVPFDYASPISGMMYLEGDNLDSYITAAKADSRLSDHLKRLSFNTPDDFKRSDWDLLRAANRIRYHAFMSAGGSFYDPGDPTQAGENWHYQLGNLVYGLKGEVVIAEPTLSGTYPDAGNTCHSKLRLPADRCIAVRTGNSAYALVEKQFGHEQ